jgi:CRISPR-associated protein Csx17
MQAPLLLPGCRHDILGHYLKAIGLLRVLAKCAAPEHRDPDAEGWWDTGRACFCLNSPKYPTQEKLVELFALYYRPTPIFAAWNNEPGGSAELSTAFGINNEWQSASNISQKVVSADKRKKPENKDKLIASEALTTYRASANDAVTEALDAISASFLSSNTDHPLFLSKGIAGRAHLWKTHWEYLSVIERLRRAYQTARNKINAQTGTAKKREKLEAEAAEKLQSIACLLPFELGCASPAKGKGTPFFPDAIKAYNIGSGWVTDDYPFNALDYVLAVEGAFAMRGSVGRTLAANSRRFAAFPFVFDTGEDMVDDGNNVKDTASSLWFPLWDRPVTFAELSSFITDAQARLPGKEARFSAEFMRALHSQGVDAGFTGWQEFRFKMKASRVPWVSTGTYVDFSFREDATRLNLALHPLDESRFLDQFEVRWKGGAADTKSPHPVRETINAAMETAMREPTPHACLDLLGTIYRACDKMAVSRSFRDTLPGKTARFFRPLPMDDWRHLLSGLDTQPEFRIARAVASIVGRLKQPDGTPSKALPMLGSLLPLTFGTDSVWYLPDPPSRQAVWSGTDLCHDLAAVLARRYLDSLTDERPALVSAFGAPLTDVLAFLRRDLDDHQIARWIEALSLIDWRLVNTTDTPCPRNETEPSALPIEYAALRTLLELECERREAGDTAKRRSQQPIALLCQRSASTLPQAVTEALRWIAIWGFANPWGREAKVRKAHLAGRDIVGLRAISPGVDSGRLAAAVCIPLDWRDRETLFRAISLPQIN